MARAFVAESMPSCDCDCACDCLTRPGLRGTKGVAARANATLEPMLSTRLLAGEAHGRIDCDVGGRAAAEAAAAAASWVLDPLALAEMGGRGGRADEALPRPAAVPATDDMRERASDRSLWLQEIRPSGVLLASARHVGEVNS